MSLSGFLRTFISFLSISLLLGCSSTPTSENTLAAPAATPQKEAEPNEIRLVKFIEFSKSDLKILEKKVSSEVKDLKLPTGSTASCAKNECHLSFPDKNVVISQDGKEAGTLQLLNASTVLKRSEILDLLKIMDKAKNKKIEVKKEAGRMTCSSQSCAVDIVLPRTINFTATVDIKDQPRELEGALLRALIFGAFGPR